MKWIGQHIWSFISRFRSDVYLENVAESAQDHVVGIDANGKLYKQDASVGDITGVTAGDALTGGGDTGAITINHEDTSSQASVDNSGRTYIQDITLDTYGHVTGLTSATETVTDTNTTYTASTGLDLSGTAFAVDVSDFMTNGSDNRVVTATGTDAMNAEANLTWDGDDFTVTSATTARPDVYIKATANHAKPPHLYFVKDKGAAGTNGDQPGLIAFMGDNADQTLRTFAQIITFATEVTAGDEAGQINIEVASSSGTTSVSRNAFTAVGSSSAYNVDTNIGYGTASTATIAGTLTMGSTAAMTNAGLLSVAAQTNITSLGTLTGLTTSGAIELGHADDTTLARSAAGIATIEGKQIFTTNVPALTSGAAGVPAVTMQTRRTITTAEANDMHNTPIELVPAQGANTVILPIGGMIRVDRAGAQSQSACDLNMHYADLEPGVFFSTSLAHIRRFMVSETGDRVFSITTIISAQEIAQNLTSGTNKALEISFDAAATADCFTSIDIFLTYQVISIA